MFYGPYMYETNQSNESAKDIGKTTYVLVPAYNAQEYIEKCIKSVLDSNQAQIWMICVDDGSTDSTPSILNSLAQKYSQLIVIHTPNGGPSQARNSGLDYALNQIRPNVFLMFIDADDWLSPGYVDEMVLESENGADIVCSSFTFANGNTSHPFRGMDSAFGRYNGFDGTKLLLTDRTIQSHPHCKLFKADLWQGVRFPLGIHYMEDQATLFKVFAKASNISLIPNYGYMYRQHENSLCAAPFSNKKTLDGLEGYLEACSYDFGNMDADQNRELKENAMQAFAATFLTLYPHYISKKATAEEKRRFKAIMSFVRTHNAVKNFCPSTKNERLKRACYLWLRPFYRLLYKVAAPRVG